MNSILVTGGAGYIGSHTCKVLSERGYEPVVLDNLSRGHRESVKWGPLEQGDLLDRAFVNEVLARRRPEAVVHFAALAYVDESVEKPGDYYRNNVAATLNLLECMRDAQVRTLVFSSSCATYGEVSGDRITEEHAQAPINPYGMTKLVAERMIRDFGAAHGLRFALLRYFNAAGADPDGQIGEEHDPETHLIPRVIEAALDNGEVSVYGGDYDTADRTCVRDYIHVADLAQAHVRALEMLAAGTESLVCNLGSGKGVSVREVITEVERQTGKKIAVRVAQRRPGDPPRLVADISRANRLMGWAPSRSDLAAVVADAFQWRRVRRGAHTGSAR